MQHSPSSEAAGTGVAALAKSLAPAVVQVTYCASNALPFRVEWRSSRGPVVFFGLTPDDAANAAQAALARGSVLGPARAHTDPLGDSAWADAMREMIADIESDRAETHRRPALRVLRGGAPS